MNQTHTQTLINTQSHCLGLYCCCSMPPGGWCRSFCLDFLCNYCLFLKPCWLNESLLECNKISFIDTCYDLQVLSFHLLNANLYEILYSILQVCVIRLGYTFCLHIILHNLFTKVFPTVCTYSIFTLKLSGNGQQVRPSQSYTLRQW